MITLPWKPGVAPDHGGPGVVSATRTEIARYRDIPGIVLRGHVLRSGWSQFEGSVGVKLGLDPIRKVSWSVSMWETREDLRDFVQSPLHLAIHAPYRDRMSVRGRQWETERFERRGAWREAKRRLGPKARGAPRGAGLPLPSRFMALQYKLSDRGRHPLAFVVARGEPTRGDLGGLRGAHQGLIVTFKRSGEPVPTPVTIGLSPEGRLYFRCEPHVAKIKRLRANPRVLVAPCTLRGKPTGPLVEARARVLSADESRRADEVLESNWTGRMKLLERFYDRIGVPAVYVEVAPVP
jgi:PPOX class probable F420-dependent enzyme